MAPFQVYANGVSQAKTTEELLSALQVLHRGLLGERDCVCTVDDVKSICLTKFNQVGGQNGGVWTVPVAQAYFSIIQLFSTPVTPAPAYPGQSKYCERLSVSAVFPQLTFSILVHFFAPSLSQPCHRHIFSRLQRQRLCQL